jgi:hypothetical protein
MTPRRVPRVCGVVEVLLGWYFLAISVDPGFTPKGLANPVVIGRSRPRPTAPPTKPGCGRP